MNKISIFFLATLSFAFLFGVIFPIEAESSRASFAPATMPTPQFPARIDRIELSRKEVIIPCPRFPESILPISENDPCFNDDGLIQVKTVIVNPKNKEISYFYTISGGKVIGTGESVIWDLNNIRPGTYSLTVGIGDGRRMSSQTITETVTVRECCCPMPCVCPTVEISGGGEVKAGETVTFTAEFSGGTTADVTYRWKISSGEIIAGQETSTITVQTGKEMAGKPLTATVTLGGFPPACNCQPSDEETVTVVSP